MKILKFGIKWDVFLATAPSNRLPFTGGVYMIVIKNTVTGKYTVVYIGRTQCFFMRFGNHLVRRLYLKKSKKHEQVLVFFHEALEDKNKLERMLINKHNPIMNKYGNVKIQKTPRQQRQYYLPIKP